MVLESLDKSQIDITRLSIPEVQLPSEMPFDVERDLDENDWENIMDSLKHYRNEEQWGNFYMLAHEIVLLDEKRRPDLDLNDEVWQGYRKLIFKFRQNSQWTLLARQIANGRELFPEREREPELQEIDESTWREMLANCEKERNMPAIGKFVSSASSLVRLRPDRAAELKLTEHDWQEIKALLDIFHPLHSAPDPYEFSRVEVASRILFPHRAEELKLTKETWASMQESLMERRARNSFTVAEFASNLKILAADSVLPTKQGLKLSMHPTGKMVETNNMPKTRNF
jgi:hypothetical protein